MSQVRYFEGHLDFKRGRSQGGTTIRTYNVLDSLDILERCALGAFQVLISQVFHRIDIKIANACARCHRNTFGVVWNTDSRQLLLHTHDRATLCSVTTGTVSQLFERFVVLIILL